MKGKSNNKIQWFLLSTSMTRFVNFLLSHMDRHPHFNFAFPLLQHTVHLQMYTPEFLHSVDSPVLPLISLMERKQKEGKAFNWPGRQGTKMIAGEEQHCLSVKIEKLIFLFLFFLPFLSVFLLPTFPFILLNLKNTNWLHYFYLFIWKTAILSFLLFCKCYCCEPCQRGFGGWCRNLLGT